METRETRKTPLFTSLCKPNGQTLNLPVHFFSENPDTLELKMQIHRYTRKSVTPRVSESALLAKQRETPENEWIRSKSESRYPRT